MKSQSLKCYNCLCEVCTRHKCVYQSYRKSMLSVCLDTTRRKLCPRTKCDNFVNAKRHPVFKVIRRYKKEDRILSMLHLIAERLERPGE